MTPLPPLNPLKMFEAAGRLLSISKAAEELFVTPAAVSRQIRVLEEFLNFQLFRREHGGLSLTPAGAKYLAEITPLFMALRETTNAAMGGGYRRRVLRIRSPATFAVRWLIPRLAGFHQLHPGIDVQLTTSAAPLDFSREDIDAGIELGDGHWPRLIVQKLVPNELVPVMSPRAGAAGPREPRELASETLLHSLARIDDWALWLRAAGAPGVNAYQGMKYETSLLSYQAAVEGHGVAMAQKALVEKDLAEGRLVMPFGLALDRGDHTYYFASPREREESVELAAFRRWLADAVAASSTTVPSAL